MKKGVSKSHQKGEPQKSLIAQSIDKVAVDTYNGRIHIDWDHHAAVTPFGQLAFFIEFLKVTELFDGYVESCPLTFSSPNAPSKLPYLFSWLDSIVAEQRPQFIRGDCNFGTDAVMTACEERQQPYLFKVKQTPNIKRFISQKMVESNWVTAGQGWEGAEGLLKLMGWEEERRIVVLRRKLKKEVGVLQKDRLSGQEVFHFAEMGEDMQVYEYAALVTTLDDEILTIAQHYRDRADSENNFDELKNQWGWAGYTTHDLHRCQLMARIIALIYNWWTLFVRVINPSHHLEAITSRPLLLHAVGRQVHHAGQKIIQVSSGHADFKKMQPALSCVSDFFKKLMACAEQLSPKERMFQIFYRAFKKFIDSGQPRPQKLFLTPG